MYSNKYTIVTPKENVVGAIHEAYIESGDYLVLLHGIGRSYRSMRIMANYFIKKGFHVLNIDYPATHFPLEDLIEQIHTTLNPILQKQKKPIHFITHSMGGLITRGMINKYKLENVGKVVMLGPPNHGSEVADFLNPYKLYQWIYGPAGQQLTTEHGQYDELLGTVNFSLGIIAGDRTLLPFFSLWVLPGKDDGLVTVASSKLSGMKDHITLHANHALMMMNKKVILQADHFIQYEKFSRE